MQTAESYNYFLVLEKKVCQVFNNVVEFSILCGVQEEFLLEKIDSYIQSRLEIVYLINYCRLDSSSLSR